MVAFSSINNVMPFFFLLLMVCVHSSLCGGEGRRARRIINSPPPNELILVFGGWLWGSSAPSQPPPPPPPPGEAPGAQSSRLTLQAQSLRVLILNISVWLNETTSLLNHYLWLDKLFLLATESLPRCMLSAVFSSVCMGTIWQMPLIVSPLVPEGR